MSFRQSLRVAARKTQALPRRARRAARHWRPTAVAMPTEMSELRERLVDALALRSHGAPEQRRLGRWRAPAVDGRAADADAAETYGDDFRVDDVEQARRERRE